MRVKAFLAMFIMVSTICRAQVSPDEAYRRLREREAQRRAAESRPSKPPAAKTSPDDGEPPLGIVPPKEDPTTRSSPQQKFTEYHDSKLGFKLRYPEGWKQRQAHDNKEDVTSFIADEPDGDDLLLEILMVRKLEVYAHSDLDGTMVRLEDAYRHGRNAPIEIISESNITMAGVPGREFVFLGHVDNHPFKVIAALVIERGEGWSLSMGFNPKTFDRRVKLFDEAVKSFELVKPALPMPTLVEHSDVVHGYKMKYPGEWKRNDASGAIVFQFTSEGARTLTPKPSVNVTVTYASHISPGKARLDAALDGFMEEDEKRVKQQFPDVKWVSESSTEINGVSARKLVYIAKAGSVQMEVQQVIMLASNGQTYRVTFTTSAADYDQVSPILNAMTDSFWVTAVR
ncbi:MAG TPA: PsbP-related protein [Tepidisphaeraceae bacterium]|nr:PsbP-related protein [Tepidisphaeraceae bacterium]